MEYMIANKKDLTQGHTDHFSLAQRIWQMKQSAAHKQQMEVPARLLNWIHNNLLHWIEVTPQASTAHLYTCIQSQNTKTCNYHH